MEKRKYPFTFDIDDTDDTDKGARDLEAVFFRTDFNRTNKVLLAKVELEVKVGNRQ